MVSTAHGRKDNDKKITRELQYILPQGAVSSMRNLGSAALELALVARGGLEGNIQIGLSSHDFAAGTLLVQEAGGKITNFDGSPWKFPDNYFIASNGIFHDLLVEEVQKQVKRFKV